MSDPRNRMPDEEPVGIPKPSVGEGSFVHDTPDSPEDALKAFVNYVMKGLRAAPVKDQLLFSWTGLPDGTAGPTAMVGNRIEDPRALLAATSTLIQMLSHRFGVKPVPFLKILLLKAKEWK